jgi:SAM-dependent methyltransferase
MATHQEIGGLSDAELLQRMVTSYPERFGETFWQFFTAQVSPLLPPRPVIIDLGCGPGLFLRDLSARYPQAQLYGYDVTTAMVEHAQQLDYPGARPRVVVHDMLAQPLPLAPGAVHLVCMTAVLHLFDDPYGALAEIRRLLGAAGVFMLYDWVRTPLQVYLTSRLEGTGEAREVSRQRCMRLFPVHNKYTLDDWQWLLAETGFRVSFTTQWRPHFQVFVAQARSD